MKAARGVIDRASNDIGAEDFELHPSRGRPPGLLQLVGDIAAVVAQLRVQAVDG